MIRIKHVLNLIVATVLSLGLASPSHALVSWTFNGSGQNVTGSTFVGSDGTTNATVNGVANTGGSNTIAAAQVFMWNGLGVCNANESCGNVPQHSTDNSSWFDMVLFSFNQSVELTHASVGWWSNDSDISVLAFTGGGDVAATLAGNTYASLTGNGWDFIGHYANLSSNAGGTAAINDGTNTGGSSVSSSYWLIGAANSQVAATGLTGAKDYVKIDMLKGNITPPPCTNCGGGNVPEPASLALMGIGLLGLGASRRRKQII